MSDRTEWLDSLKQGDEVLVSARYSRSILRVQRVTATQITVGRSKYRRRDGRQIGADTWNPVFLYKPTQDDRDKIAKANLRARIEMYVKDDSCELSVLRAMAACMKEQKP